MTTQHKPSTYQVDELDMKLIEELEVNCRQSNRQLAKKLDTNPTTVQTRIQRLLDAKAINIAVVVEPAAVNLNTRVFMGLNVNASRIDDAIAYLESLASVQVINLTIGRYDMLIFTVFHNTAEMMRFIDGELSQTPGLMNVEETMAMKVVKRSWAQFRGLEGWTKEFKVRELDELEVRLVNEMVASPRESLTDLGQKLGVSRKLISKKLARMTDENLIHFTCIVRPESFGFGIQAQIFLKVEPGQIDTAADMLVQNRRIPHVVIISGKFKIFFVVFFRNLEELSRFKRNDLAAIPGIIEHEVVIRLALLKQSFLLG